MKKIKDERLILKNLHNIRIAYIIQTIGIVGILIYDLITKGSEAMVKTPLWFVFIVTGIVSAYLSMRISVDHESSKKAPKTRLLVWLTVAIIVSFLMGILTFMIDGNGLLIGSIAFICFLVPGLYVYLLRIR